MKVYSFHYKVRLSGIKPFGCHRYWYSHTAVSITITAQFSLSNHIMKRKSDYFTESGFAASFIGSTSRTSYGLILAPCLKQILEGLFNFSGGCTMTSSSLHELEKMIIIIAKY